MVNATATKLFIQILLCKLYKLSPLKLEIFKTGSSELKHAFTFVNL